MQFPDEARSFLSPIDPVAAPTVQKNQLIEGRNTFSEEAEAEGGVVGILWEGFRAKDTVDHFLAVLIFYYK